MRNLLSVLFVGLLILCTGALMAQTPDGETPAQESVCDNESGAAYGLCNAYCEAMDCHLDDPQASTNACTKVGDKFEQITGRRPPCEINCPCFTLEDLQALGTVAECGENFPGFNDLAAAIYTNGNRACSGFLCASVNTRSCATLNLAAGQLLVVDPITEQEDNDCRTLILQNCANPNAVPASSSSPSTIPFIDQ